MSISMQKRPLCGKDLKSETPGDIQNAISAALGIVNVTVTLASTSKSSSERGHAGEAVDAVKQMYHCYCDGK